MKKFLIALSLLAPPAHLLIVPRFPLLDPAFEVPLFHFYVVAFFTFAAFVVSSFMAVALGQDSRPRHQLLAIAFAVMGVLFFIHGVTTPNAVITGYNPGISWSARLTMLLGGIIFGLAALDSPRRPLKIRSLTLIKGSLALFIIAFILIVIFAPHWLSNIDSRSSPWHQHSVFYISMLTWAAAAAGLWRTWRQTGERLDGVMSLIAGWFAIGSVSLHHFPIWHLSWWLYHGQLLLGVIFALWTLSLTYEKLRRFRSTTYYAAVGLIVTAGLALLSAHLVSRLVEYVLLTPTSGISQVAGQVVLQSPQMIAVQVNARRLGLVLSGTMMGLLFLALLGVVRRSDRLVDERTRELAKAYTDLQAAEAMRDDLTGMIVHDLRGPLTTIGLNLDIIDKVEADPDGEEKRSRYLQRVRRSTADLLGLVNQILDTARLEQGQMQLAPQPLAIDQLLQEKVESFESEAAAGSKQIAYEIDHALPAVLADPQLVSRVLDNLIGNAFKFTQQGGRITLRARPNGSAVIVEVEDDGAGIPPDAAGQIFDKFFQVTGEDSQPLRRGSGLGLNFCKLVVEAHCGQIWVDSEPGRGSTFGFTLPYDA